MQIGILGALNQIIKWLISILSKKDNDYFKPFIRGQLILKKCIDGQGLKKNFSIYHFDQFGMVTLKIVAQKFLKK